MGVKRVAYVWRVSRDWIEKQSNRLNPKRWGGGLDEYLADCE